MSAHTPAPWRWNEGYLVTGSGRDYTQICAGDIDGECEPSNPADARLIAAAPDLLDALREVAGELRTIQITHRDHWSNERVNLVSAFLLQAERAIAKATGGA